MNYPEYDSKISYRVTVLDYETKNNTHHQNDNGYWDAILSNLEASIDSRWETPNHFWHSWCNGNLYTDFKKKTFKEQKQLFNKLNLSCDDKESLWAFITVGFNEQTITPNKMHAVSIKVANLKYFTYCDYVLEKHRENGEHHHTHFLVKFDQKYPPSKVIQWVYQTKGMKEVCLNQTFVDYLGPGKANKPYQPFETYYNYVRGLKKESKLKYVAKDDVWREANMIPKLNEKVL